MAPLVTDYVEIQRDEIAALKSIYMGDFEEDEAKLGAWNVGTKSWISDPGDSS